MGGRFGGSFQRPVWAPKGPRPVSKPCRNLPAASWRTSEEHAADFVQAYLGTKRLLVPSENNQKHITPRIRAGIGPIISNSSGKWQSGPSPGTSRGRETKDKVKHRVFNTARTRPSSATPASDDETDAELDAPPYEAFVPTKCSSSSLYFSLLHVSLYLLPYATQ